MAAGASLDAIRAFYINRDIDTVRRARIEAQLMRLPIRWARHAAVQGTALPPVLADYFPADTKLTVGEIGCYASHLMVARRIVAAGLSCALVFEDDAVLGERFEERLREILDHLPRTWDFVHLSGSGRHAVKAVGSLSDGDLVRFSRVPPNTVGYLISQSGARKLLKPFPRRWPIDTDIRQPWKFQLDIYGVSPTLVTHDDELPSIILRSGGRSKLRRGLRPSRHCPTGNPLKTPEGLVFNIGKLGLMNWLACGLSNGASRIFSVPKATAEMAPRTSA